MDRNAIELDPLRQFEAEHDEALGVLEKLEAAAEALEVEEPTPAHLDVARKALTFLTTAVRQHNEAEERALFPLLREDAPVTVFEEEHRSLRALETELAQALDDRDATRRVPPVARAIVALLRAHIARENLVLFPMARVLLGDEGLTRVAERLRITA